MGAAGVAARAAARQAFQDPGSTHAVGDQTQAAHTGRYLRQNILK